MNEKPRAVLITGRCRSGGAAVADVCHHLGFPMGTSFLAGGPPTWRFDWEDVDLTFALASAQEHYQAGPDERWWAKYIERRLDRSRVMGFEGTIGFKGALLGVHGALLAKVLTLRGIPWVGIWSQRGEAAIENSIGRFGASGRALLEWNLAIGTATPAWGGMWKVVRYEELVQEPAATVRELAEYLGVDDYVAVARARARVMDPTS